MRQLFVNAAVNETLDRFLRERGVNDVIVVDMHQQPRRDKNTGLDIALEHADDGLPIILTTWLPELRLADDMRWHACRGLPHLAVVELPVALDAYLFAYQEALAAKKVADPLARELVAITLPTNALGQLKHDLSYARQDETKRKQWLALAAKAGYTGTFEDIAQKVAADQVEWPAPFTGRTFEGVFCDVESTLIVDFQINRKVADKLTELSATRPITIWTGGDIGEASELIRGFGITWKLTSKRLFSGAIVETIIDDQEEDELTRQYGFICRERVQP